MSKSSICIFLHQGMGDCVMALPSLERFENKSNHKDKKIFVVVKSKLEADVIKLSNLNIEKFFFISSANKYQRFLNILKVSFSLRFEGIDTLVAPIISGNLFNYVALCIISASRTFVPKEKYISKLSYSDRLSEYGINSPHYSIYMAEFFYRADLISASSLEEISRLNTSSNFESENIFLKKFKSISIGPGCGVNETNKVPSNEWFVSLSRKINNISNIEKIILYGGGSDGRLLKLMLLAFTKIKVEVLVNADINTLISKLKHTDLIISGTTGPGHVAGLSGTPMIILSESTNPRESAPYVKNIVNIRAGLKCSPCYRRGFLNGCGFRCADLISHDDIINVITHKKNNKEIDNDILITKKSIFLKI